MQIKYNSSKECRECRRGWQRYNPRKTKKDRKIKCPEVMKIVQFENHSPPLASCAKTPLRSMSSSKVPVSAMVPS